MTVSQLLASTTSAELAEWRAYNVIERARESGTPDVEEKLHQTFGSAARGR